MKHTLIRLGNSKALAHHLATDERFTVCEKRIYTVDMYATNQTPADGEKVSRNVPSVDYGQHETKQHLPRARCKGDLVL